MHIIQFLFGLGGYLSPSIPLTHVYLKLDYKQINVNDVSVSVKTYIHWRSFLEDNCMEKKSFEGLY